MKYIAEMLVKKAYWFDAKDLKDADTFARKLAKENSDTLRAVKLYEDWERDEAERTTYHNPDARPPKKAA